jgi:hypothetical protein
MFAMGMQRPLNNPLVKMRRGSRIPVLINNSPWGTYQLSTSQLRENWPFLYHDFRQSGNRVLDPISRFCPTFRNVADFATEPYVWAYFGSRLKNLERENRYGFQGPPVRGQDPENPLFLLYDEIQQDINAGSLLSLQMYLPGVVRIFRRLCEVLSCTDYRGRSYGQGLYMEVLEMARLFAPIISRDAPDCMYRILESIDQMTDGDGITLRMVINQIAPADQQAVEYEAMREFRSGSLAGDRILQAFI